MLYEIDDNGRRVPSLLYRQLFALLQLAVGEDALRLTQGKLCSPTEIASCLEVCQIDWKALYDIAEKQSVVGICWAGIERLPKDRMPDMDMLMEWLGQAEYIKTQNEAIDERCVEVQEHCRKAGLKSTILKGQGVGALYGELANLRTSGDIDLWVDADWKGVMDYANAISPNREFDWKHAHLNLFVDTIVEVHWWPSVSDHPLYRKRLKDYYRDQVANQCNNIVQLNCGEKSFSITATDAAFDAVHVLLHIYSHFLYEGVGLRQVMDYYFVLKALEPSRRPEIVQRYKDFGIYNFSRAVIFVLKQVFNMKVEYLLTEPDEKLGWTLLEDIMESGNFGHASAENQVRNESTAHRWMRRMKRKVRLIKYNPVGLLCNPLYKIGLLVWKYKIIKKYNL